jgi:ribose 5-phosphate isomerase B
MNIGIAADHGGFELKSKLIDALHSWGHKVIDYGALRFDPADDYPDFVFRLAKSVASGEVNRGVAICGSGVGASVAANKVAGVRAALIHDAFSAHQGVEDDAMNVMCLGARVVGPSLAVDLLRIFLLARFSEAERHRRRLAKVTSIEEGCALREQEGSDPCSPPPG